jgi:cell division protein FtsI/penicillin-binding protein 2
VLTETLKSFGFGAKTGLGLGGEDSGLVPSKWGWGTRESIMQGYALLATPMQLCRAMSAIANGGRLVTPRLVAGSMQPGGEVMVEVSDSHDPQVVERQTALEVRRLLADVAVRGTARRVQDEIKRWNMFGKTGTAHRTIKGRYNEEHYVSTFVGGAPYEAPRLVIAVSIYDADKSIGPVPGKGHHAGIVSAPAAARMLNRALDYLDVPDSPDLPEPPAHIASQLINYVAPKLKGE